MTLLLIKIIYFPYWIKIWTIGFSYMYELNGHAVMFDTYIMYLI